MSRKFLDDNVEILGKIADLPGAGNTAYEAGHRFRNRDDGSIFINEGTARAPVAIFGNAFYNRTVLEEDFRKAPALAATLDPGTVNQAALRLYTGANKDFVISGTSGVDAGSVLGADGGVVLTTTAADADQLMVSPAPLINSVPQSSWLSTLWTSTKKPVFEASIITGASIAKVAIVAGFKVTATDVLSTDADQAYFKFLDTYNSGKWGLVSSNTNVDTEQNSALAVVASTRYHLKIVVDASRIPWFFINGTFVGKTAALKTATSYIPVIGLAGRGTTPGAKSMTLRRLRCSRDL